MTASLSGVFNLQQFTDTGDLAAGYRLYTYAPATTTQKVAFTDAAGTVPHTYTSDGIGGEFIGLNPRGELPAPLFLIAGGYDIALKTPDGGTVWTRRAEAIGDYSDNLAADLANSSNAAKGAGLVGINQQLAYVAYTEGDFIANLPLLPTGPAFGAKFDGTTDDTAALNACATAARAAGRVMQMPRKGTAKVSGSINVSGIEVIAFGTTNINIQATSAQFDVLTSTGNTKIHGLYVHGGWDGATAGQSGDIFSAIYVSPNNPYTIALENCTFQYAKKRGVYIERGGYSSLRNVKVNAFGLHGLELFGNSGSDATTTVEVTGTSVFSDAPFGYGMKMTQVINVLVCGAISEYSKGVLIQGDTNRSISLINYYQENTSGGNYVDWATSSGIGFMVSGSFGGGAVIPFNDNFQNQAYAGNSNLTEPALPFANRIIVGDGGEFTTAVAGSFTAVSVVLSPGTWEVHGYVQTLNSAGGTITQLGAVLTQNAADAGINTATGAIVFGADEQTYNPGSNADLRVSPYDIIQNTSSSNVTVYLRTYIGRTAGTVSYRGVIKAIRKLA